MIGGRGSTEHGGNMVISWALGRESKRGVATIIVTLRQKRCSVIARARGAG